VVMYRQSVEPTHPGNPVVGSWGCSKMILYYDGFREAGEGTSIPLGLYNLDKIKKWGKSRNWCTNYLILRAINHQVVVGHDDMVGMDRGGGCKW